MKKFLIAVLAILICSHVALAADSKRAKVKPARHGYWATASWDILREWDFIDHKDLRPTRIPAPDGKTVFVIIPKNVTEEGEHITVPEHFIERDGKGLEGDEINAGVAPELLWAPDSQAFAITWSQGGAVGNFVIDVFLIENDHVRFVNVYENVRADVAHTFPVCLAPPKMPQMKICDEELVELSKEKPEWVNAVAVHWLNGSREILIAGLVPCSSFWGSNMCKWKGYRVEVSTGNILQTYTRKEFTKRWGALKKNWY